MSSILPVQLLVAAVMLLTVVNSQAQQAAGKDSLKAVLGYGNQKAIADNPFNRELYS